MNYLQSMAGRLGSGMGIDPRRRMARQLFAQGVDTSPAHLGTGIGRLGKALIASLMMKESMGQEADAFKAMMEQEKDTFRQPTEAEFGEAYPAAFPGMQRSTIDNQPQAIYTDPQQVTPPDSVLMGMGQIPEIQDKIDRYTAGLPGESSFMSPLDRSPLEEGIALQEQNYEKEMERLRGEIPPVTAYTPTPIEPERIEKRDYAQLLQDYKGDETKQIKLDKMPRMEWMMQNLQNMEGMESNPFARRMLMQLMMSNIGREEEERLHKRGVGEQKTAADLKFERSKLGMSQTQWEQAKELARYKKDTPTTDMRNFEKAKTDPAYADFLEAHNKIGGRPSAAIQNYEHLQTLLKIKDPTARKIAVDNWWNTVRTSKFLDTGAKIQVVTPGAPREAAAIFEKELPLEKRPEYLGEAEQVKAERKVEGEKLAEARWDAPQAQRETTSMLALLDQIYKLDSKGKLTYTHPGFEGVVGATWLPGMRFLHGSQEYAMDKLINQVKDKNFLSAFESLKGGGHITEIEGEKATDSIAAIHIGMPEEDFIIEMEKVRTVLLNGLAIAQGKMQGTMGPRSGRTGDATGRSNADMVWDPVTKKLIPNRRQ